MGSKFVPDGWAIDLLWPDSTRSVGLISGTNWPTRKQAIEEYIKESGYDWETIKDAGYRCVRVYRKVEDK